MNLDNFLQFQDLSLNWHDCFQPTGSRCIGPVTLSEVYGEASCRYRERKESSTVLLYLQVPGKNRAAASWGHSTEAGGRGT